MATSSSKKVTNIFIPKFVADNLKWHERDGLETWYRKNKCDDFLHDTDDDFEKTVIVNFDIIRNRNTIDDKKLKQYQTVDYEEIKKYPQSQQVKITSSIFRNINREDLHVTPNLVKSHFQGHKSENVKKSIGRGKFLKICRDTMYAKYW